MKKFLEKLTRHTATAASYITLGTLVSTIWDNKAQKESKRLIENIQNNVDQIRKSVDLNRNNINDETLTKIIKLSNDFDRKMDNTLNRIDSIKEINNKLVELKNDSKTNNELILQYNQEINNNIELSNKGFEESKGLLEQIMDILNNMNYSNNFLNNIQNIINNYIKFLNSLDLSHLTALAHLLSSIVILWSLSTIIFINYGEYLINKLKLEERYPKLARFIQLRRKFKQYYFFFNISNIIIILFILIYANFYYLIYF